MQSDYLSCTKCKETKPVSEFHRSHRKGRTRTVNYECKVCICDRTKWSHLKSKYGITKETFAAMQQHQGGRCAICGVHKDELTKEFHVDHNHQTDKVRGLLCTNCNTGIGLLKDDPSLILKALNYVCQDGVWKEERNERIL